MATLHPLLSFVCHPGTIASLTPILAFDATFNCGRLICRQSERRFECSTWRKANSHAFLVTVGGYIVMYWEKKQAHSPRCSGKCSKTILRRFLLRNFGILVRASSAIVNCFWTVPLWWCVFVFPKAMGGQAQFFGRAAFGYYKNNVANFGDENQSIL